MLSEVVYTRRHCPLMSDDASVSGLGFTRSSLHTLAPHVCRQRAPVLVVRLWPCMRPRPHTALHRVRRSTLECALEELGRAVGGFHPYAQAGRCVDAAFLLVRGDQAPLHRLDQREQIRLHTPSGTRRCVSGRKLGPVWADERHSRVCGALERGDCRLQRSIRARGSVRSWRSSTPPNPNAKYLELSAPCGAGSGGSCEQSAAADRCARNPRYRPPTALVHAAARHKCVVCLLAKGGARGFNPVGLGIPL